MSVHLPAIIYCEITLCYFTRIYDLIWRCFRRWCDVIAFQLTSDMTQSLLCLFVWCTHAFSIVHIFCDASIERTANNESLNIFWTQLFGLFLAVNIKYWPKITNATRFLPSNSNVVCDPAACVCLFIYRYGIGRWHSAVTRCVLPVSVLCDVHGRSQPPSNDALTLPVDSSSFSDERADAVTCIWRGETAELVKRPLQNVKPVSECEHFFMNNLHQSKRHSSSP